jgi:hypothetical protein
VVSWNVLGAHVHVNASGDRRVEMVRLRSETSATLNASIKPRGGPLSACTFEYRTSTNYGSSVPCSALPGSGSSPVTVSASIAAGLAANTEYHFRVSATNTAGTSKGEDVTFRTA